MAYEIIVVAAIIIFFVVLYYKFGGRRQPRGYRKLNISRRRFDLTEEKKTRKRIKDLLK